MVNDSRPDDPISLLAKVLSSSTSTQSAPSKPTPVQPVDVVKRKCFEALWAASKPKTGARKKAKTEGPPEQTKIQVPLRKSQSGGKKKMKGKLSNKEKLPTAASKTRNITTFLKPRGN